MTDFIVLGCLILVGVGTFMLWRSRKLRDDEDRRERSYLKSLGDKNSE